MNVNISEDNEITNFREICMGKIPEGLLYRGSYPIFGMEPERDNAYNKLVSDAKIECVINLADNGRINDEANFQSYIEKYFLEEIGLSEKELELLKGKLTRKV
jgi:hypothetical protein